MRDSALMALRGRAELALRSAYPDVLGVGIGLRETDGVVTNRPALRVYVKKKRALVEMDEQDILPQSFEGMAIDVLEPIDFAPVHCEDIKMYPRLMGGISISTGQRNSSGHTEVGTLGFFATVIGVAGPKNVVVVTNKHVLASAGENVGDKVMQPKLIQASPAPPAGLLQTGLVVDKFNVPQGRRLGEIDKLGKMGLHPFSYDATPPIDYYVDCATARLDIVISSTCNKSTGVDYKNEIRKLRIGVEGKSQIVDIARLSPGDVAAGEHNGSNTDPSDDYVVYKVGRRTARTVGKVIDAYYPSMGEISGVEAALGDITGSFVIQSTSPDCDGIDRFAAEGDSGAAIINQQNQLVGMLHAAGLGSGHTNKAFACHIHPVMDYLEILPITEANPPIGPAGMARDDQPGAFMPTESHVLALRERIEAHERAGPLYKGFMQHWDEIVLLVNQRRPLLVAWHRAKGPAFVAHLSESAKRPGHRIPFEIDGATRLETLARMADLLATEGSPELQNFIGAHREQALELVGSIDDLHSFVDDLYARQSDG